MGYFEDSAGAVDGGARGGGISEDGFPWIGFVNAVKCIVDNAWLRSTIELPFLFMWWDQLVLL